MDIVLIRKRMDNEDCPLYIEELIENERFEDSVALGIAKLYVDKGASALSEPQWYTLIKKGLIDGNYVEDCENCLNTIPWSEMLGATYIYEDNYCSYCRHTLEKLDRT